MHVLHISTAKGWRGGEQQIAYLSSELEKLGVTQSFACIDQEPLYFYLQNQGYSPIGLKKDFGSTWSNITSLRDAAPDLVHLHDSGAHTLAILAYYAGFKPPLVLSRRVDFPPKNSPLTRFKYNHPAVKKILCVSRFIENIMRQTLRDVSKATTVHSGIDLSRFQNLKRDYLRKVFHIPNDTLIIGNTSALADHKDYFTFIDTAEKVLHYGAKAKFFIIGEGKDRPKIEQYIKEKGLEGQIIMTGFLKDIEHIIGSLDIFFLSSKEEGLGTSVLDAMAAEVPIVATEAGGVPEMIEDGVTGLSAPPKSPEKLAEKIQTLAGDEQLRKRLIRGASEKVKEFSVENTAQKTLQAYREVVSSI